MKAELLNIATEKINEHDEIGVIVLGREMKKLISNSSDLEKRIINIIDKAIDQESLVVSLMIQNSEDEAIADKKNIIKKLKLGFTENHSS